ncbi:TIGR02391 family protein [Rhodococcus pyridinivorans]|uniref:TIGR02391 family protein n=1 Tax=Rhodococcus pyridinivorans TaxID=103816 RepID=UPI000688C99A|nr:TIGR02391 family protein [Rhodococcus pyridinivorans]
MHTNQTLNSSDRSDDKVHKVRDISAPWQAQHGTVTGTCDSLRVDNTKNPAYLRNVATAVDEFSEAFAAFMALHAVTTGLPPGIAPAVYPKQTCPEHVALAAARKVDRAAGKAQEASAITGVKIAVEGRSAIDPIAAWGTIRQPRPLLGVDDVYTGCDQIKGHLEQMIAHAETQTTPPMDSAAMHPLIWGAAGRLWRDGHYRLSVTSAAEALIAQVKTRTGRNDVAEAALWQETFADKPPVPGRPRLRWPGDSNDRTVKSMNEGLRQFTAGMQLTIRNSAAHDTGEMLQQDALERLAVLSVVARLVDQCDLIEAPISQGDTP